MMDKIETYGKDYYENGVEKGISGYTAYHWRPEYVLPLANELKSRFIMNPDENKVLDYGCAKGYLVKALRLLGVQAYGYDISTYALHTAPKDVQKYLHKKCPGEQYRLVIAKDVLEHVPHDHIDATLTHLEGLTDNNGTCFVVVPLGDKGLFRIREYELDKTHKIKEDEEWWINKFKKAGFDIEEFMYSFPGAKNHWEKVHPQGNGVFVLRKAVWD
jgi:SAM-dependent methyltransferase